MKKIPKKAHLFIYLGLFCLGLSLFFQSANWEQIMLGHSAAKINKNLEEVENLIQENVNKQTTQACLSGKEKRLMSGFVKEIAKYNAIYFVSSADSILQWNSNRFFSKNDTESIYYQLFKEVEMGGQLYTWEVYVPLIKRYPFTNKYLSDKKNSKLGLKKQFTLSKKPIPNQLSEEIVLSDQSVYLLFDSKNRKNHLFLYFFWLGIILTFVAINVIQSRNSAIREVTAFVFIIALIGLFSLNRVDLLLKEFGLWAPFQYASGFAASLGHLLTYSILALWLIYLVDTRILALWYNRLERKWQKQSILVTVMLAVLFCLGLYIKIIASLTIDSQGLLVIQKLYTFDSYSIVGVVIACVLSLSLFILIKKLVPVLNIKLRMTTSILGVILWVLLASGLTAIIILNSNKVRSRDRYELAASKIALEKDPVAEYLLEDNLEKYFEKNRGELYELYKQSSNDAISYLRDNVLGAYFNHYDIVIAQAQNPSDSLAIIFDYNDKEDYKVIFPGNDTCCALDIFMLPRKTIKGNSYPELLLEDGVSNFINEEDYNYIIYKREKPYKSSGKLVKDLINKDFEEISKRKDVFHVNVGRFDVFFQETEHHFFTNLALVSFLFCFFLLALLFLYLLKFIIVDNDFNTLVNNYQNMFLRDKISMMMVSFIMISLIGLVAYTFKNVSDEYGEYHHSRLKRKASSILTSINYKLSDLSSLSSDSSQAILNDMLKELANIHSFDINLYNFQGVLLATSQPDIFNKKILSRLISPQAKALIDSDKITNKTSYLYTLDEQIGSLQYISAYAGIRNNEDGKLIGYINLPYFSQKEDLGSEIASFLKGFVNIYFVFILAGTILILLISNYLTRSLDIIAQKMKAVQLGKKNEHIFWHSNDEIGDLVDQYNKMIDKLDESARLLSVSEREGAWRDMAKQVAHEIKNPLTPMKLSIQHLQMAIKNEDKNVKELTVKVAQTMIEQIDALSRIATEFSSFAKMPKANNEVLVINDVIEGVYTLFKDTSEATITLDSPIKKLQIYIDKDLIIRVLNNILKNALQALSNDKSGKIEIILVKEDNNIKIAISDNGIGIEKEQYDKVFVPNFTTKSSGTGIGLAISKNIVVQAGGDIWFDSKLGEGSTFYIQLPLYEK